MHQMSAMAAAITAVAYGHRRWQGGETSKPFRGCPTPPSRDKGRKPQDNGKPHGHSRRRSYEIARGAATTIEDSLLRAAGQ